MDAFMILKSAKYDTEISVDHFNQLIRDFEVQYLQDRDYHHRLEVHRRPVVVMNETLNELNSYLQEIQGREELRDDDRERKVYGYVTTLINDIWTADKRVRTLYNAVKQYCLLRSKDFNVIAVHVAEYRAMNKLYRKIRRAVYKMQAKKNSLEIPQTNVIEQKDQVHHPSTKALSKPAIQTSPERSVPIDPNNGRVIFNTRPQTWKELQNFVGQLFREMGFDVEISKVLDHVRGKKEVDVYATDKNSEYHPQILIECKHWNYSVKQEVVHAFHDVMVNYGANTGFIVSKSGFQQGCYDAIKNTNIHLVSLEELEEKYYAKWQAGMINSSMSLSDVLFPFWDTSGGKMPADGKPISFDTQQLLDQAYQPFHYIDARFLLIGGQPIYNYPLTLPVLNDHFEVTGKAIIKNDRDLFDFIGANRDKALRHYRLLYREILEA